MDIFELFQRVDSLLEQEQKEISHRQCTHIEMFFTPNGPLPCGSQYFLTLNDEYTLGFTHEELISFRDKITEGVRKSIQQAEPAQAEKSAACIVCGLPVDQDSGFETTIGAIHFSHDLTKN